MDDYRLYSVRVQRRRILRNEGARRGKCIAVRFKVQLSDTFDLDTFVGLSAYFFWHSSVRPESEK